MVNDLHFSVFLDLPAPGKQFSMPSRHCAYVNQCCPSPSYPPFPAEASIIRPQKRPNYKDLLFQPVHGQVLRTVNALNEHGFTGMCFHVAYQRHFPPVLPYEITVFFHFVEITMYETLMRPHEVEAKYPLEVRTSGWRRAQRHGRPSGREEITADSFFCRLQSQEKTRRSGDELDLARCWRTHR